MSKTKAKSKTIRKEVGTVTVMATCGHLPLVSETVEWINPNTSIPVPEIALDFGDSGVVTLDPERPEHKKILDVFHPWYEAGEDPRIEQHAVRIVPPAKFAIPYPAWDGHTVEKCLESVTDHGYDPELCLRYELQKDEPREELVEGLEKLIDSPVAEDPLSVPSID